MTQEEIYDLKIQPLMTMIIGICQEYKIPMIASFACPNDEPHGNDLRCTTALLDPEFIGDQKGFKEALDILFNKPNFQALVIHVIKPPDI